MSDVCIIHLPSPPKLNVFRDWAGGYGTALESSREYPGHDRGYFEVPCLQFLYIARNLQDRSLDVHYTNLQQYERFIISDFLESLRLRHPKVLLTALSLPSLEHDLAILRAIKDHFDVRIVLIGMIAKLYHERILRGQYADVVVMEQEEAVTPDVVTALLQGHATPVRGAFQLQDRSIISPPSDRRMTDLNLVEFPAYDLLDMASYASTFPFKTRLRYMTLLTSKGCPYPCSYCPYPVGFGKHVLFRAPELVLSDIRKLVRDFHVQLLVFRDQLFTLNKTHCEAICRGIIESHIQVTWLCETRYDLVDKALLQLMYEAGCRKINYGLESGDEKLFLSMGKANAKRGLDYFGQIIQETKTAGIVCHTHLMLGLPDESWKSIRKTIRFLKKYQPDSMQAAIFIPYPGTPLGDRLAEENRIDNHNLQDYTGFKAVIPTTYMSVEEIDEARYHIYNVWDKTLWMRVKNKLRYWVQFYGHYKSAHSRSQ